MSDPADVSTTPMSYDVFISYARADATDDAAELERILSEHDVRAYLDVSEPPRPGGDLTEEMKRAIRDARVFMPVLSNRYIESWWAQREYEIAQSEQKKIVPIVVGSRESVQWLGSRISGWFDTNRVIITLGTKQRDRAIAVWTLIENTAPAPFIIEATEAVAARSTVDALATIDSLVAAHPVRGLQLDQLTAYKSQLLRLAGRREEARSIMDSIRLSPHHPYQIVQKALVSSAILRIDLGDYTDARARLAEAAAVLGRQTSWRSDEKLRRKLLAEVTREMARSYLQETYELRDDPQMSCFELEVAWSMYMEALALVTEDEDLLGHAWVHENLGVLAKLYAERSAGQDPDPAPPPVIGLDYPAIWRLRGSTDRLIERSYYHLGTAMRLFKRVVDATARREGEAWARYHRVQTDLLANDESAGALREAVAELRVVAELFEGIVEGQGLTYTQLFYCSRQLGDHQTASGYAARALELLLASETHDALIRDLESHLSNTGTQP